MEGYYTKGSDSSTGILRIEVKNLPEFEKMVNRAKEEADQLQRTINRMKNFEMEITFSTGDKETISEKLKPLSQQQYP